MIEDDWPSDGFREADHYGRTIQRLQAEVARLTEQLRIANEALEYLSNGARTGKTVRHMSTMADEALTRMSVVE
jgi:hypothetical protein